MERQIDKQTESREIDREIDRQERVRRYQGILFGRDTNKFLRSLSFSRPFSFTPLRSRRSHHPMRAHDVFLFSLVLSQVEYLASRELFRGCMCMVMKTVAREERRVQIHWRAKRRQQNRRSYIQAGFLFRCIDTRSASHRSGRGSSRRLLTYKRGQIDRQIGRSINDRQKVGYLVLYCLSLCCVGSMVRWMEFPRR